MVLKGNSFNFFGMRWYDLLTGSDIDAWALAGVSDPVVRDALVSHSLSDRDKQQQMRPGNKNILNHSTALAVDLTIPNRIHQVYVQK